MFYKKGFEDDIWDYHFSACFRPKNFQWLRNSCKNSNLPTFYKNTFNSCLLASTLPGAFLMFFKSSRRSQNIITDSVHPGLYFAVQNEAINISVFDTDGWYCITPWGKSEGRSLFWSRHSILSSPACLVECRHTNEANWLPLESRDEDFKR